MKSMYTKMLGLILLICLPFSLAAKELNYPTRAITMIVAYPPGGSTDVTARIVADRLSQLLGEPVVVENRAGASGTIGADFAAKQKPDGYTIYLGSAAELTIAPVARQNLTYNPLIDFVPVSQIGRVPLFLAINPNKVPVDDLQGFLEWVNSQEGAANYSSFGNNTVNHFVGEMFLQDADLEAVHVPYKGSAPSIQDLVSGHVDYTFDTITATLPHVKSERLKIIGITTPERSPLAPDVPTLSESGLDGFTADTWSSLLVPAGTPDEIVNVLYEAIVEIVGMKDVKKQLNDLGIEPVGSSPTEFAQFLEAEIERWNALAGQMDLEKQ